MIQITDYWQLPTTKQRKQFNLIKKQEARAALEAEAEEKQMIIHKGKLVSAEDYPCTCELASPHFCYEGRENIEKKWTRKEIKDECCHCPCHTWYEPF